MTQECMISQDDIQSLCQKVRDLRKTGKYFKLSKSLKIQICHWKQSGVSFSKIRTEIGVQSASIKIWNQKYLVKKEEKSFQILTVEQEKTKNLTFCYANGKLSVDVPLDQLNPEMMRVLTSCLM